MNATPSWAARAWLPYALAGVAWVTLGAVLGNPKGLGLIFIGFSCLSIGVAGAAWRVHHGRGLIHNRPPDPYR